MRTAPFISRGLCCLAIGCLWFVAGCGNRPDRLLEKTLASEKTAQAARAANDPERARKAADTAAEAVSKFQRIVTNDASAGDLEVLREKLARAEAAARSARDQAEIASEEQERRHILATLKVRAYQKTRGYVVGSVLPPLADMAERAGRRGTNDLSALERSLAEQGWKLASFVSGRPALPDSTPDWAGAAADLRNWSTNQPVQFKGVLAFTFVLIGRGDFALAEFENVEPGSLNTADAEKIYHGARAFLYSSQGWNRLATPEVEAFCRLAETSAEGGDPWLALFHGWLAAGAFNEGDYAGMDAELSRSLRAWPDNPVATYLTGQRLAADGQWDKVADSLEAQAAGTTNEWLAARLAQRARDLRDGKGGSKELVLDAELLLRLAAEAALKEQKNAAAGKFGQMLEQALSLYRDLAGKLPGAEEP